MYLYLYIYSSFNVLVNFIYLFFPFNRKLKFFSIHFYFFSFDNFFLIPEKKFKIKPLTFYFFFDKIINLFWEFEVKKNFCLFVIQKILIESNFLFFFFNDNFVSRFNDDGLTSTLWCIFIFIYSFSFHFSESQMVANKIKKMFLKKK